MQRRPGRGTIRPIAIPSAEGEERCGRCGTELTRNTPSVLVRRGAEKRCLPCWYSTWNEHDHPEGMTAEGCPACNEAEHRPHTHQLWAESEGERIRIEIVGCPGCIDAEAAALRAEGSSGDEPDEPGVDEEISLCGGLTRQFHVNCEHDVPWQGYGLEAWLERVDPGHERPWIR